MEGKVALITGSSSGIGRETAILFASKGAKVVVTGRNEDKVNQVVAACDEVSPNESTALGVVGNLNDTEFLENLIKTTIENCGELHVLVNNAGHGSIALMEDEDLMEKFDEMIATNLRAVVHLTQLVLPYLIETKGVIVNVSSLLSTKPHGEMPLYCMTKAALDMFTKCLALQVSCKSVRVNSVNPGYIQTAFHSHVSSDETLIDALEEQQAEKAPMKRVGNPSEIAKAIAYMASEESSYVTGTTLVVDGGLSLT